MLADPKAEALVNNFAEQWLFLRNVQSVAPDENIFPNFDDNLRQAIQARNRTVLRQHREGGRRRDGSADGQLYVRE